MVGVTAGCEVESGAGEEDVEEARPVLPPLVPVLAPVRVPPPRGRATAHTPQLEHVSTVRRSQQDIRSPYSAASHLAGRKLRGPRFMTARGSSALACRHEFVLGSSPRRASWWHDPRLCLLHRSPPRAARAQAGQAVGGRGGPGGGLPAAGGHRPGPPYGGRPPRGWR